MVLNLIEFIILIKLTVDDEKSMTISILDLVLLFITELLILKTQEIFISLRVCLFSICLFFFIYSLTKGIGLGDVILASILSLRFQNITDYFYFFTLTYSIGALYSIYILLIKGANLKDSIPFVKFIVFGYYIFFYWSTYEYYYYK